ncbi:MAG: hypothetical protein JO364_08605 [Pseudonocardiales bacterium]|nr:hypothetical protein [Pseudonocardiales bacterium]
MRAWSRRWAPRTPGGEASAPGSKVGISQGRRAVLVGVSAPLVLATAVVTVTLGPAATSAAAQTPTTPVNVTVQTPGATRGPASGLSEIKTNAGCGRGALISGGGINQTIDTATASNGNHVNGTEPSPDGSTESTGTPGVVATDVARWLALGGSGAMVDSSFSTTAFALCLTSNLITHTQVVMNRLTGPTTASTPAVAVASCPTTTVLLGGGARTTPANTGSLKPIASYPTFHNAAHDFGHKAAVDGDTHPDSWAAVGLNGGGSGTTPNTTYAYAICSQPGIDTTGVTVTVRSHEVSGPTTATTSQTTTTSCGPADGTLISGGAAISGGNPTTTDFTAPGSQGDHLNGSFPSNTTGTPVGNGTTTAASWTAFTHTGGADSPHTYSDVWALCAHTSSGPAPRPIPAPGAIPAPRPVLGSTPVPGGTTLPRLPGPITIPAPIPGGVTTPTTALTVIEVPLPLGLGGIAIPITHVALSDGTGTVQSQDGSTTLGGPTPVIAGLAFGPICVLPTGSHSLTAVFTPTNPTNVAPLTSNTVTLSF